MRTAVFVGVLGLGVALSADAAHGQAQSQQPATRQVQSFTATATGPVVSIDKPQGRLTMQTLDGPLVLRLPPETLAKLTQMKTGDRVTFGLGFAEMPRAAASKTDPSASPSSKSPQPPGESTGAPMGMTATIKGEVASVDAKAGTLAVKTDDGTGNLRFPPAALQGLKQGDRLTVSAVLVENR